MGELVKKKDNRRAFIDTLVELASKDARIVLVVPDVGFLYIEEFSKRFPTRFINTGVTEQSTIVMAAAMALSGMRPFVYSMINFVAFRPFEMVRNAVALHKAPVVLLGVKGSESYKFLGFSHNMVFEDEDTYHLSPYMDCYLPANEDAVKKALADAYQSPKPTYIRL